MCRYRHVRGTLIGVVLAALAALLTALHLRTPAGQLKPGSYLIIAGYLGPKIFSSGPLGPRNGIVRNLGANRPIAFGGDYFCWWNSESNALYFRRRSGVSHIPCPTEWLHRYGGIALFCAGMRVFARVEFVNGRAIRFHWYRCDPNTSDHWSRFSGAREALSAAGVPTEVLGHLMLQMLEEGMSFSIGPDLQSVAIVDAGGPIVFTSSKQLALPIPNEATLKFGHVNCVGFTLSRGEFLLGVSMPTGIPSFVARVDTASGRISKIAELPFPTFGPIEIVDADSPLVPLLADKPQ